MSSSFSQGVWEPTAPAGDANPSNQEISPEKRKMLRRVLLSTFFGGLVEWYDFYLYSLASALVFSALFFPGVDPTAGILASFATLAVGWLARPIGGIIGGHFGDKIGRKTVLMASFFGMGAASALIGILPTYATAGLIAPILLVVLRILQGLSAGAEFGGALLMTVEHAPGNKRARYGSVSMLAIFGGILLANAAFYAFSGFLSQEAFLAWGWRVPFLISVVLTFLTFYIRRKVVESPVFENEVQHTGDDQVSQESPVQNESASTEKFPLLKILKTSPLRLLASVGIMLAPSAISTLPTAVLVAYGVAVGFSRNDLLVISMSSAAMALVSILVTAPLSDRYGRKPIIFIGIGAATVLSFVVFPLFDTGSFWLAWAGVLALMFFHPMGLTAAPILLAEIFPARERYSGVSFSYQVSSTIGGGFTPLIAAALLAAAGGPPHSITVSLYIAGLCLLTFIGLAFLPNTGRPRPVTTVKAANRQNTPR